MADGFDAGGSPTLLRDAVSNRNCGVSFDLDRFRISIRATGEDIAATVRDYYRKCFTRGATFGGDAEASRRAPDDVKAFLKKVFKL